MPQISKPIAKSIQPDLWKPYELKFNRLQADNKYKLEKVYTLCYGPMGIYEATTVGYYWLVHVPLQEDILCFPKEKLADLKRVGEYLADNFVRQLRLKHPRLVRNKTPKWVHYWRRAMKEKGEWIDPKSFKSLPDANQPCEELTEQQIQEIEESLDE